MKLLIAPDKLKGSLSAAGAARAIAAGALRARPNAEVDLCPLADGGEGTLEALLSGSDGQRRTSRVADALGRPVEAEWALLDGGRTALIEASGAIGLARLAPTERDPTRTSSFGVGQLVGAALDAGARRIVIGLGGSATSDGGAGLAQALGARFGDAPTPIRARDLSALGAIDLAAIDPRLAATEIVAACDVDSPLLGPHGAARLYAPQKGASAEQVQELERALARFAELFPDLDPARPGAGAAGGLGFGLVAVAGASIVSGAELVLDAARFDERVAGVDAVITAEGRLDAQSLRGKVVIAVARRARRAGVPAIALVGSVGDDVEAARAEGLTAWYALTSDGVTTAQAIAEAAPRLTELAERVIAAL